MKIKLLSVWIGPEHPPRWLSKLKERMAVYKTVEWELIQPRLESVNWAASQVSGFKVCKASAYAACDLRPLYYDMFRFWYGPTDWWGWMDLDLLTGDLDNLLPPLLEGHDIVTTDPHCIHGPLTLLRNTPEVNRLWRYEPALGRVLASPEYMNWDESGFGLDKPHPVNPNVTRLALSKGLKVHFDDRCWTETRGVRNGVPERGCRLHLNRLLENPTSRELICYHFNREPKSWPLPDKWDRFRVSLNRAALAGTTDTQYGQSSVPKEVPEESPEYWARRLAKALSAGEVHRAVLDASLGDWRVIQDHSREVLQRRLGAGDRVLDAGCGYGALLEVLPKGVHYLGVDYCSEMIQYANKRLENLGLTVGSTGFSVADLRYLQGLESDSFDWAICRGLEGTIKTLKSVAEWEQIVSEMLRVAKRVILIDMARGHKVLFR